MYALFPAGPSYMEESNSERKTRAVARAGTFGLGQENFVPGKEGH